jgi:hypothetical protein
MKPIHFLFIFLGSIGFLGLMVLSGFISSWSQKTGEPSSNYETSQQAEEPTSDYKAYQQSNDPTSVLVKRCASTAGIPANESQHKITPQEMRDLTDCVDRELKK